MSAAKGTRPPNAGQGRPKGVPNKMSAMLKDMILGALEEAGGEGGGQAYLVQQAKAQPVAFMALIAKVLPTQVTGEGSGPIVISWMANKPDEATW
jgi:hypothetical protein